MGKIFSTEELIERIIEQYYAANEGQIFLDLKSKTEELEEPFIEEFKQEIADYKKNKLRLMQTRSSGNEAGFVQEEENPEMVTGFSLLEEDSFDKGEIDFPKLKEIEIFIATLLGHFNLAFYSLEEFKNFMTDTLIDDFERQGYSKRMLEEIKNLIAVLIDKKKLIEDSKKNMRKQKILQNTVQAFASIVEVYLKDFIRESGSTPSIQQIDVFTKYLYDLIQDRYFEGFKKQQKLDFEETEFADNIIKRIIVKQIRSVK